MSLLLKPIQAILQALSQEDSPRQLAGGFAVGALIGLVPKTSLLAQLVLFALNIIQVNLAAGYITTALVTCLTPLTDKLAHPIGLFLLERPALRGLWTWLYNLPIVPWTAFNNTVVLGSFMLGLVLLYPLYRLSIPFFEKYQPVIAARIKKLKLIQILTGAQYAERFKP